LTAPGDAIATAAAQIRPPDESAREAARALQLRLTKPAGALGRLEELGIWAAGIRREVAPPIGRKVIVLAAADHGVAAEGVSAYPQDVTWQMMANFLADGAAVNVLAAHAGAEVRLVDAGVRRDSDDPRVYVAKTRCGTSNIASRPAMSRDEAEILIERGIELAREECSRGAGVIALGDMGIGNTTPAAAITSVLTGAPPRVIAGRGTGIDDTAFETKVAAIEHAIQINTPDATDAVDVVAKVGGFELAFLAGVTIGASAGSVPIVLDGYPTTAAALVAAAIAPACVDYLLASHLSAEPGHRIALSHLGLRPLLEFEMRLGEGSGAALAITLLEAALRLPREMATFDGAGVSRATVETPNEA
jgi:nicotinate-nucleotide--dimethylbenzimidazole phosphoribosyltransferase